MIKHAPPLMETGRKVLNRLNSTYGVSWEKISEITGISIGSLCRYADGGKLPNKYKSRLGLVYYHDLFAMPEKELYWAIKNRERTLPITEDMQR